MGLCDEFLYLGELKRNAQICLELIGKQTISSDIQNRSRGRNGSCSTSTQLSGRELLMPDEVRLWTMEKRFCLCAANAP